MGWVGRMSNVNYSKLILRLHNEIKIVNNLLQKINAKTTEKRMPYISDNSPKIHSDPSIKSDPGQHSQFLQCFLGRGVLTSFMSFGL